MEKLKYLQLYADDIRLLQGNGLTDADIGIVVCAVFRYLDTGEDPDIPARLKWPYAIMKDKANKSMEKYSRKCAVNAANGAKGGKAKRDNQKASRSKKSPFTKTEFLRIAKDATEEMELSCNRDNLDYMLERLKDKGWTFGNFDIDTEERLKEYLAAYYPPEEADYDPTFNFARRKIFDALLEHGASSIQEASDYATSAAESYTPGKGYEMPDGQFLNSNEAAEAILFDINE